MLTYLPTYLPTHLSAYIDPTIRSNLGRAAGIMQHNLCWSGAATVGLESIL